MAKKAQGKSSTDVLLEVKGDLTDAQVALAEAKTSVDQAAAGVDALLATTPPDPVPPDPPVDGDITIGSGADSLVLKVCEDPWKEHAQFTVSIDNAQVGGTLTATASRKAGESQNVIVKGAYGTTQHKCTVNFLNDLDEGSGKDRNLYVLSATLNGTAVPNSKLDLMSAGPMSFQFQAAGGVVPPPNGGGTPPGDYINMQTDMSAHSSGIVSFSDGGTTCTLTVRQGDHPSWDSSCDFAGLERHGDPYGSVIHLDYTFRVHAGAPINSNDWSLAGEMHADNAQVGRACSPPIALHVKGDRMQVVWIAGAKAQSGDKWFWSDVTAPIVRDHDYHIQIDCKMIQDSTGFLKFRVDGQSFVDYHGVMGFPSSHYYCPDFYRAASSETVVLTYSKMKIWID